LTFDKRKRFLTKKAKKTKKVFFSGMIFFQVWHFFRFFFRYDWLVEESRPERHLVAVDAASIAIQQSCNQWCSP